MPQRKNAAKRLKIDRTKALHNLKMKSELKKELKALRRLIQEGKGDEAKTGIRKAFARLDRAAAKGLLHKNTAARRKSRLSLMLNKKA
jgi:small subunit ribosomal protein S20